MIQTILTIVIFAAMVVSYSMNKIPMALTSMLGMLLLVITHCVEASTVLSTIGSSTVITMISMFIIAAGLQQVGLQYTSAGKGGFITTMYVVLVPVLGFFLRKKVSVNVWISVALSVVGLYLLSCAGVTEINKGDLMMLGCALFFTVQITLVDELAGGFDGLRINCIQTLVTAVLSAVAMFLTETPLWSNIISCWFPLCYAGILSMGVAYSLQIIGQKHLDPTPASLIMGLESAFALLFGWLLLHEKLSAPELVGCGLVFVAVMLSQLPEGFLKKKKHG